MKQTHHRIEDLPDAILQCILSPLPLKSAVRTSILSRRWRDLWKHNLAHATTLDFGEELANAQTPEQFVDTVNRYIQLHNGKKINGFRISSHLQNQYQADAEKWISFATSRGVQELDLDFNHGTDQVEDEVESFIKLPSFLFSCDSVTRLNLGLCDFNPPMDFTGFSFLETLRLRQVSITDDNLERLLLNCPLLVCLVLRECYNLNSIKVLGSNLRLRSLKVVNCWDAYEIEILAPRLQSFHFYGDMFYGYSFHNVSALVDAFISSVGCECTEPEHDFVNILSGISRSQLKILTICCGSLLYLHNFEELHHDELPITFPDLEELQILMAVFDIYYLGLIYSFFKNTRCPCLEKLFIKLPTIPSDTSIKQSVEEFSGCIFNGLRTLKINNFRGSEVEMKLVEFFLEKAINLESLVLVSPRSRFSQEDMKTVSIAQSRSESCMTQSRLLQDQLAILPRASAETQMVLCEEGKDESRLCPSHTEYYVDF